MRANYEYQTAWRRARGVKPLKTGPQTDHGTLSRYHSGCRCAACREASRVKAAAWRLQSHEAFASGAVSPVHGSASTYANYGCRCQPCTTAATRRMRDYGNGVRTPRTPAIDRFMAKVQKRPSGCWEWQAGRSRDGHGNFSVGGRAIRAHRWSYEYFVGPIPDGLVIDHLCVNPPCVNPDHLEPVTHRENTLRYLAWRASLDAITEAAA